MFQKFAKGVCMIRSMIFFKSKFCRYQCGFRKVLNTQNIFLSITEKLLLTCDKKNICRAILTDLSNLLTDLLSPDLPIAKFNVYGFNQNALNFIQNFVFRRSKKTKVGFSLSDLLDILYNIVQCFILGHLLFNINLCDLLLSEYSPELTSVADDITPYECRINYNEVINNLKDTVKNLFKWFQCNNSKTNASKYHIFPLTI